MLLQRLYGDLQKDQEVMKSSLDYLAVVKAYAITAVEGFNDANAVSDEQFVIAAYQASQLSNAWNYRAVYTELISTGKIDLIESDTLKELILGYYSDDWSTTEYHATATYRQYIRGVLPFVIQDAIRKKCGDTSIRVAQTFAYKLPSSCDLQLSDDLFSESAANLRSQTEMLSFLQYQISVYEAQVFHIEQFHIDVQKLLVAIKEFQKWLYLTQ